MFQKLGGAFTASTIATKAESNTPAIEQTAFVTLQPPRKLLAVPAFASAANTQTLNPSSPPHTRFHYQQPKITTLPRGR
ncbi:hypothetical protein [Microcoleus sp.]|uniref:hypothetical protein n=1 Tax=Microcoleus sp. TaxID=44472 RepID=UPI0035934360